MINLCIRRTPFKLFIGLINDDSDMPAYDGGFLPANLPEIRRKFLIESDKEYVRLLEARDKIIHERSGNESECEKYMRISNKLIEEMVNSVEVYPTGTVAVLPIGQHG
jgi:hypothetical protein